MCVNRGAHLKSLALAGIGDTIVVLYRAVMHRRNAARRVTGVLIVRASREAAHPRLDKRAATISDETTIGLSA